MSRRCRPGSGERGSCLDLQAGRHLCGALANVCLFQFVFVVRLFVSICISLSVCLVFTVCVFCTKRERSWIRDVRSQCYRGKKLPHDVR